MASSPVPPNETTRRDDETGSSAATTKAFSRRGLTIMVTAVAAALLVGLLAGVQLGRSEAPAAAPSPSASSSSPSDAAPSASQAAPAYQETPLVKRDKDDPMAVGSVDAPVTVVEFFDYRCPFCAVYGRDTAPTIKKEYVESGKVRIEYRDMAIFGEDSVRAAVAGRAAAKQGKYTEFVDAVFQAAPESGHPPMPADKLVGFAKKAGVPDLKAFEKDLSSEELREAVKKDTDAAKQFGVTGTPTFIIGQQGVSGAQPVDVFRQVYNQAIASATEAK